MAVWTGGIEPGSAARPEQAPGRVPSRDYRVDEAISLPPPTIAPGLAPPMTEVGISMGAIS